MSSPSARTRVFALLGDPIQHSLSPVLQNQAFQDAGVDAVYVALRCDTEGLGRLMVGLALAGGGGNVTLPHKERAATLIDVPSEAVRRTGACNTFWAEAGKIHGDNTDVEGFRRALRLEFEEPVVGMRVLLLGAGGAARAVLAALMDEGVSEVSVMNRSRERAMAMTRRIGDERVRLVEDLGSLAGRDFDLVVNATSVGLDPDEAPPVDLAELGQIGAVIDLVYGPRPTLLLQAAKELGIPASDGARMLAHQGAVAFERWLGVPAPLEAMEGTVRGALGR